MAIVDNDGAIMQKALQQARIAMQEGNYPVGAVLCVNGEVVDSARNEKGAKGDRISHAETLLFIRNSQRLFAEERSGQVDIDLYTTMEPCLMCFGTSVIHRVKRIVVACNDPRGNISGIDPSLIGEWYVKNWPKLSFGVCAIESCKLLCDYFSGLSGEENQATALLFRRQLAGLKNN